MKDNKYEKIIAVIGLLSLFCITIGVSYSVFSYVKEGTTDNSIRTESITFLYTEVDKIGNGISIEDAFPISDSQGKMQTGSGNVFDFKITSTTNNSSISYEVTARKSKDSTLEESAVKLYLTEVEGEKETELLLDNYNKLPQTEKVEKEKYSEKVIYNGEVEANSNYEKDFKLRMWIDSGIDFSKDEQGNYPYNNKTFTIKVNVYANAKVVEEKIEKTSDNTIQVITASYNEKLWQYRSSITKIIIKNELEPMEELQKFNISESGEGDIIAYYDPDTTTAYIQGDGKIYANEDSSFLFYNFSKLTTIEGLEYLDTSHVTNMQNMFMSCIKLESLNLNSWDTSSVTNMAFMFTSCISLSNLNISNWNTQNVENMQNVFNACQALASLDLSNWNTSNVTNMYNMFYGCSSLTNIGNSNNWDTSSVTNMTYMFYNCVRLTDLYMDTWNFSSEVALDYMFYGCLKLTTTMNITSTNIKSYRNMFTAAATEENAEIKVNYTDETSDLVDKMIDTKAPGNHVKKGDLITV